MSKPWKRCRFKVPVGCETPVIFPIPGPYWVTGYDANDDSIIVAYLPDDEPLLRYWPEAFDLDIDECDGPEFSGRFPEPEWWKVLKAKESADA